MNILQVCAYAAPYPGNFIKSLYTLDKKLSDKGHKTIYAFPYTAKKCTWCIDLQKNRKVYFLPLAKARILPKTYYILKDIFKTESIDIVHSHFELYDIPISRTAPKNVKVFWHLHDPISNENGFISNFINRLQYGLLSKQAYLISVSDFYRKYAVSLGFKEKNTCTVLNGIDCNRINFPYHNNKEYEFLTFGWDFYRKGADIIFDALEKLNNNGYNCKLLFNGNDSTYNTLKEYFNGNIPKYIVFQSFVEDINEIFSKCNVFIQASRKETFAYAVCEAAYAGMNVITSDIPGLEWAHNIPNISFFESENTEELYFLLKEQIDNNFYVDNTKLENSRKYIYNNYSTDKWAEDIINIYLSI